MGRNWNKRDFSVALLSRRITGLSMATTFGQCFYCRETGTAQLV
jgi:hypothetical protein